MKIIASKDNGKNYKKIGSKQFPLEKKLEELISDENIMTNMTLGPDEDLTLIKLANQFKTNAGLLDVLAIDNSGNIYIIETKLHKNGTKREIIAQVLDYASALWLEYRNNFKNFEDQFYETTNKHLSEHIEEKLGGYSEIRDALEKNLNEGSFKFVTVWDEFDDKLRDTINYLNQKSDLSIYAVTFDYYEDDDFKILVPSYYGMESEKLSERRKSIRRTWTKDEVIAEIKKNLDHDEVLALEKLMKCLEDNNAKLKTGRGISGSINPVFDKLSKENENPKSLFTLDGSGFLAINYDWLNPKLGEKIERKLSECKELAEYDKTLGHPRYEKNQWTRNVDVIIDTINYALDQAK